jgi:hypothetical protein
MPGLTHKLAGQPKKNSHILPSGAREGGRKSRRRNEKKVSSWTVKVLMSWIFLRPRVFGFEWSFSSLSLFSFSATFNWLCVCTGHTTVTRRISSLSFLSSVGHSFLGKLP